MLATNAHDEQRQLLYIMVIGFHHKKGCQVEFVYPNNDRIGMSSASHAAELYVLPKKWKHLPSLALPDGSHNYNNDYIYFHLEDDDRDEENTQAVSKTSKPKRTIFGVSCYRQINASEVLIKDVDVTRNTLQKSVCILSRYPFYSSLRMKLQSITTAYFEQKDFSRTQLLVNAFESLSKSYASSHLSLTSSSQRLLSSNANLASQERSKYLIGLSLTDLVVRYQHKILVLFKLILLQRKCLFQLKPVSNLSNTIMSLVSLIPDVFMPFGEQQTTGLERCGGYFDSIDLVNSELERKNNRRKSSAITAGAPLSSTNNSAPAFEKGRKHKKKFMSFSKKKSNHHHHFFPSNPQQSQNLTAPPNGGHNSTTSITSSYSSNSIRTVDTSSKVEPNDVINTSAASGASGSSTKAEQSVDDSSTKSSLFNVLSSNTQRFFSFANSPTAKVNNSATDAADADLYNKLAADDQKHEMLDVKQSKLDLKSNIYLSNQSSNSSLNRNEDTASAAATTTTNTAVATDDDQTTPVSAQISDLIKSKVSDVIKLVDWSSPQLPATVVDSSSKAVASPSAEAHHHQHSPVSSAKKPSAQEIPLNDLLEHDFGMPLDLYNEFNILHPYLSLYYLDYFTTINKMNTKLYCTTTLMMSMMKDNTGTRTAAANDGEPANADNAQSPNEPFDPFRPKQEPVNQPIGYTIGATNVLFKQRLYDDLDAFVDETDVDLRQNETLKKQLQLTTADLRFTDYIIKHVNAARNLNDKPLSASSSGARLVSFKKTSSLSNFDPSSLSRMSAPCHDETTSNQAAANFEGSDDWIRLNFKWYLYTMLASMIKEDVALRLKADLEQTLFGMLSSAESNNSTSDASNVSLENDVVDIDDYIEKVSKTQPVENDPAVTSTPTATTKKKSKSARKSKKEQRKNSQSSSSSSSNMSMTSYFNQIQQLDGCVSYREDFNSSFVDEFKKTDCYKQWYVANAARLEKSLLNCSANEEEEDKLIVKSASNDQLSSNSNGTNSNSSIKFQGQLQQLQELDQLKSLSHPFSGQMSMSDIKLKFNFMFSNSESGRKLNKAIEEGGKLVNSTGKAVGSVFSQAKSTFSSLLSNWSSSTLATTGSPHSTVKSNSKM